MASLEPVRVYQLPGTVGMIAPVEGDEGWLLGAGRGFVYLALDGTRADHRRRCHRPGPG